MNYFYPSHVLFPADVAAGAESGDRKPGREATKHPQAPSGLLWGPVTTGPGDTPFITIQ